MSLGLRILNIIVIIVFIFANKIFYLKGGYAL